MAQLYGVNQRAFPNAGERPIFSAGFVATPLPHWSEGLARRASLQKIPSQFILFAGTAQPALEHDWVRVEICLWLARDGSTETTPGAYPNGSGVRGAD
jgi:hypothetical protein